MSPPASVHEMPSRYPDSGSPEALFISALLDTGSYVPALHGIQDKHYQLWQQVHRFCADYQAHSGKAPPVHLVQSKFPSFTYRPGIDAEWAASDFDEDHSIRDLTAQILSAIQSLKGRDYRLAISELQDGIRSSTPRARRGKALTDIDTRKSLTALPAPVCLDHSDTLEQMTGGIRPGNLWFIAARLSVGKSWILQQMAVAAAEAGWDVNFFSLEMTEEEVHERIQKVALRKVPDYYRIGQDRRDELLLEWQRSSGTIHGRDPSYGPLDATEIAACNAPETLTVIDYATLMNPVSAMGKNAEHWQSARDISKELKQIALSHRIPIISAAQINRAGAGADRVPGAEHMAESDQLGRDADVVVTMRRESKRVLLCNLAKNRHGPASRRWHVVLDPTALRFGEITQDQAFALMEEDIAQEGN